MEQVKPDILKVRDLMEMSLSIPDYQRPYKWKRKHVRQLMADVLTHSTQKNETYRLGTLVLHADKAKDTLDIVDGQQRTLTLVLLLMAIASDEGLKTALGEGFETKASKLAGLKTRSFQSTTTHAHVYHNYQEIQRCLTTWKPDTVKFLLDRCELVRVVLHDLGEAFQFFDSQNARGKDLYPHDLLKAFHLRAMEDRSAKAQEEAVREWEKLSPDDLSTLFEDYLFRIRNWRKGRSARYFTKEDVGIFKGVNIDDHAPYPYRRAAMLVQHTVTDYNRHGHRGIDGKAMAYPFQLDQVILNGKSFFDWVAHYQSLFDRIDDLEKLPEGKIRDLFRFLKRYHRRYQTGDQYVRKMFLCSLLAYQDRFGEAELDAVGTHLFRWAFQLRLRLSRVQMASIDNHAIDTGMFVQLGEAFTPGDILDIPVAATLKPGWQTIPQHDAIKDLFES